MSYVVRLKRVSDGKEVDIPWEHGPWDEAAEWLWTEGNYGCDCNRQLFFDRVDGKPETNDLDCGEGRYLIEWVKVDGKVVFEGEEMDP